jgi:hypothetical protein
VRTLLSRKRGVRRTLGIAALCLTARAVSAQALSTPGLADRTREASESRRIAMLAAGAVSAATWTQAIGMPDKWPRNWRGYGNRLGDQVGFGATEEVLRIGLGAAIPWRRAPRPCPGARAGRGTWTRVGAATKCGLAGTFVAYNRDGEPRPNVPLLGAIVAASAVSLSWRPERADAHKGQVFLLTRVGISVGASSVSRAVGAWRGR